MKIYGIDFTSAPQSGKPITCAACRLSRSSLYIQEIQLWTQFEEFEAFLRNHDPSVTAVDFPLGQPRRLIEALRWPTSWQSYVELVGAMTKTEFVKLITDYCHGQPTGDKHHFRRTDKLANACSPMMLFRVPVGKMFFEGAPRIARSGVSVHPCRPTGETRTVIEGYPALVARYLIGQQSYKGAGGDQETRRSCRRRLVRASRSDKLRIKFGIDVEYARGLQQMMIDDSSGDALDATLCAIQAASACRRKAFGIPTTADPMEGWIVDPTIEIDA